MFYKSCLGGILNYYDLKSIYSCLDSILILNEGKLSCSLISTNDYDYEYEYEYDQGKVKLK